MARSVEQKPSSGTEVRIKCCIKYAIAMVESAVFVFVCMHVCTRCDVVISAPSSLAISVDFILNANDIFVVIGNTPSPTPSRSASCSQCARWMLLLLFL